MVKQITESQLNNVAQVLSNTLENMRIYLNTEELSALNDTLGEFLNDKRDIEIVPNESTQGDLKVEICKTRNMACSTTECVTYEIDKADWEAALKEADGDEVEALEELQSHYEQDKTVRIDYDLVVNDINAEFEITVEEV